MFTVVTDGQYGSTGKGLICSYLAYKDNPDIISTTNMANAGHCTVYKDGTKFVAKALPSGAIMDKWMSDPARNRTLIAVGPTAAFTVDQLLKEIEECDLDEGQVIIHPRAGVITDEHKQIEADIKAGPKHIASTMQGCGAFLADKIMRKKELKLARDYPELEKYIFITADEYTPESYWSGWLINMIKQGNKILHEGAQGFSLDISHGSHYPQSTSRGTTAIQNLADMGLPPKYLHEVIVVIRPYPIRVGNVVEGGQTVGYSGDCYWDHEETTWRAVSEAANAPPEITKGELTTVTKRLRRVFTFSKTQLQQACDVNGATMIALNFANYLDWSCYGRNDAKVAEIPKIKEFIDMVQDLVNIPVDLIGTGPQIDHVVDLR